MISRLKILHQRGHSSFAAGTWERFLGKPAVGMATLARVTAMGDLRHFKLMETVTRPGRRPAAVLFADLEASTQLSRHLSTSRYFALGRRITRAADQCVIDAGGVVGRHASDGAVAFFLAEAAGSESLAAESSIQAALALRKALVDVAGRSELAPEELTMRFGLHWEATLYIGQIPTRGRTEVNALGDEVNESGAHRGVRHRRTCSRVKGNHRAPGPPGRCRAWHQP
jgi:class 3 adenylate cyclase